MGTVFIFFKKQLRRFLLKHGFKKLADFVQKDIEGDVRQMEVKMEELERFLAKQKLPRLKDVTPELTESDIHISDDDVLGTGGYGAVYKGEHGGSAVAVKAMFGSGDSTMKIPESASNMMRREATIMCSLNHPNILRVIGIVPTRGWIVMELCVRGSLSELLRDPEQAVDAKMSARIAAEAATGIAYLHMRDVDIVHGDMKADNCLLADDLSVRICDFGMSEVKNRSKTMTAASTGSGSTAITVAWSAPELFCAEPKSYASDVYALGLTLWEIYERAIPFSGMPEAAIVNQVLSGTRPKFTVGKVPKSIEKLVKSCLIENPKVRPTSGKVAYILTDLSTSLSSGLGEKIIAAAVGKEIVSEMKKPSGVISIGSVAVEVGKDVANAVKEDVTGSLSSDVKYKIDDELK
jgi:serine/threonine protein kinase